MYPVQRRAMFHASFWFCVFSETNKQIFDSTIYLAALFTKMHDTKYQEKFDRFFVMLKIAYFCFFCFCLICHNNNKYTQDGGTGDNISYNSLDVSQ